jgi:hypothetical protein
MEHPFRRNREDQAMADNGNGADRPKIAAEVRAWGIATITLVLQGMAAVWWAASLSAKMEVTAAAVEKMESRFASTYTASDAARDLAFLRDRLTDHEQRLRIVESSARR